MPKYLWKTSVTFNEKENKSKNTWRHADGSTDLQKESEYLGHISIDKLLLPHRRHTLFQQTT